MPFDIVGKIPGFGIWYVVFLFTLTIHEAAHAVVAWLGGDETAYQGGQVTLNPLPHIRRETFGTVVIPIVTYFYAGWMMGWASAPYDPGWAKRYPKRQALMSVAGPAANLFLAFIAFFVIKVLLAAEVLAAPHAVRFDQVVVPPPGAPEGSLLHPLAFLLSVALNLNILLFLFNLIPLPPLDGSGVLQGLMPETVGRLFESLARNPALSMMGLFIAWYGFHHIYRPAFALLLMLLHPDVVYG